MNSGTILPIPPDSQGDELVRRINDRLRDISMALEDVRRAQDTAPVTAAAAPSNSVLIAYASASLTLSAVIADITGATLTLPRPGRYLITGSFYFTALGVGDQNFTLLGFLNADGAQQPQVAAYLTQVCPSAATCSVQWVYKAPSAGKVVKLRGQKTGGTGVSVIQMQHTSITALWIGAD